MRLHPAPTPRALAGVIALLLVAACGEPPAVVGAETVAVTNAPAPTLVPIDQILAQAQAGTVTAATGQALAARGDALRARAAAIASE